MDLERGVITENFWTKSLVSFNAVFNPYALQRHTGLVTCNILTFIPGTVHIISSHYSMVLRYVVLPYCLLFVHSYILLALRFVKVLLKFY